MLDALSRVEAFQGIPLDGLARLMDEGRQRTFPAGSQLMRQGEKGESMFVLLTGRVRVQRSHPDLSRPLVLAELGPGEVVGEMGILDGEPRSATVIAIEDTETLELGADAVARKVLEYPQVAGALLRILSRRIRNTDELAEEMQRRGGAPPVAQP